MKTSETFLLPPSEWWHISRGFLCIYPCDSCYPCCLAGTFESMIFRLSPDMMICSLVPWSVKHCKTRKQSNTAIQDMGVSKNGGIPKSSILIGFSIKPSILGAHPYFWKDPYDFFRFSPAPFDPLCLSHSLYRYDHLSTIALGSHVVQDGTR